jgi:hypothetical protein
VFLGPWTDLDVNNSTGGFHQIADALVENRPKEMDQCISSELIFLLQIGLARFSGFGALRDAIANDSPVSYNKSDVPDVLYVFEGIRPNDEDIREHAFT